MYIDGKFVLQKIAKKETIILLIHALHDRLQMMSFGKVATPGWLVINETLSENWKMSCKEQLSDCACALFCVQPVRISGCRRLLCTSFQARSTANGFCEIRFDASLEVFFPRLRLCSVSNLSMHASISWDIGWLDNQSWCILIHDEAIQNC